MFLKVRKLNSAYPDTFDYSAYDQLQKRYDGDEPRGGILFRSPLKLGNFHSSCTKCHYSLEIDTYGRGCIHNCSFCYAKDTLTKYGYWNRPQPFPVDISVIRELFHKVFETDKASKWRSILERRIPFRVGSMSDAFMWIDKKYRVTHELLKILKYYRYPYIVFTRSDLVADDDYLKVIDPALAAIQFSIAGDDERLTRILEPGAPSLARRFAALKKLAEAGIWTTVRVNPLFPTYPDGYFSNRAEVTNRFNGREIPKFPLLDIEHPERFFDQLSAAKVPTVLPGFVRLTGYSVNVIAETSGINFNEFFRPEIANSGKGGNREKYYSDPEIAYYYKRLHSEANKRGIRFSTCYIGNGIKDYYQYQKMWANPSDCCDAQSNVKAFGSSCQEISWEDRARFTTQRFQYERGKATDESMASIQTKVGEGGALGEEFFVAKEAIMKKWTPAHISSEKPSHDGP
jgi:DNA repair photolyase